MNIIRKNLFHKRINTARCISFGFALIILVGALLLMLPISSKERVVTPFLSALFTTTSATCVTGLTLINVGAYFSLFGQAVILFLIQLGGLGFMTILCIVFIVSNRQIGLRNRMLIAQTMGTESLEGIVKLAKHVLYITGIIELLGAIVLSIRFVPKYGFFKGMWFSIFHSVSAFCNAGIDIIGDNSLCDYSGNALITATTAVLIILGGLGYIVWWDAARVIKNRRQNGGRFFKSLTLHSKIVLISTAILLITGTGLTLFFEYNNPLTIANLPLGEKIQASFFQSVTTRTAGFAGVPQEDLTNPTALLSILLMFIGGSPVGTAGGIKTVTAAVLLSITISMIGGKTSVSLFGRTISKQAVYKTVAVAVMSFSVMLVSTLLLSAVTDAPALDILYETVSATATVGLSRGLTGTLNNVGKIIIISTMYFGRVGPISMAIAFGGKNPSRNIIKNPTEEISIG